MPSVFPYTNGTATTDAFSDPLSTSPLNSPSHSLLHTDVNTAVETIETILQSGGGSRNLLYNGAMQVAQRGTSTASITTTGYYTADRWQFGDVTLGTHTNSVENDAPTGSGFRKSFRVLCTTADVSPAAADELVIDQRLEGQDLQAIRKGTAQAQQITLSFWVKSNVTGTYIAFLYDADNVRSVSRSYTVSSSGTWEFKTLVFPADATGAFDNDNALSLIVRFYLGAGTNFTSGTLQTAWGSAGTPANYAVGQVNVASAINNYWQVTGVQLNVGSVAAPFEFKSFGRELAECQRYYQTSYPFGSALQSVTNATDGATFICINTSDTGNGGALPVAMRGMPNFATYTTNGGVGANSARNDATGGDVTGITLAGGNERTLPRLSKLAGLSVIGTPYNAHWTASAEL